MTTMAQDQICPRLPNQKTFDELTETERQLSLEYLLRRLVSSCLANNKRIAPFLTANRHIVEPTP